MIVRGGTDLVQGWNNIISLLGSGATAVFTILAVVGVAVLLIAIIGWLWQRRKGSATIGGFPWMAVVIGAVLAGPRVVIPIILGLGDALIGLVSMLISWVTGQF